jgi:hypothetical protein
MIIPILINLVKDWAKYPQKFYVTIFYIFHEAAEGILVRSSARPEIIAGSVDEDWINALHGSANCGWR